MRRANIGKEDEKQEINKRLRLLAIVTVLSVILPIIFSYFTIHTTYVIVSESMIPTLAPGDMITTSFTKEVMANGTIIVFKSPLGGFEAHRIVGREIVKNVVYYQTKGDANDKPDSFLIPKESVIGPITRIIPKVGLFFMMPREITLLITMGLIIGYLFLTFKSTNELDKNRMEIEEVEKGESQRKEKIIQASCIVIMLLLGNCLMSAASVRLIYCTSQNTATETSPKVALQSGNIGNSNIFDDGVNAEVTVQALQWLSTWKCRMKITLNHSNVASDLTDFPILLNISSSSGVNGADVTNIFNEVGSKEKKIAVTMGDGVTQCYVEIERWDSINKNAWLWSKIPSISSTEDTVLYIYYDGSQQDNTAYVGNPGSMVAQNVWDNNFKALLHLSEISGTHTDSTSNGNSGLPQGVVSEGVSGEVGGADDFDGTSGYINYGNSITLNFEANSSFTYEGWVKTTESYGAIISQRHDLDDNAIIDICVGYDGAVRSAGRLMCLVRPSSSGGYARITGSIVNDGDWHYFTLTRNSGSVIELFVDGASQGTATDSATGGIITTNLNALGSERRWVQTDYGTADDRYLSGLIDEVRISNVERSSAWIMASYASERDHFVNWGSEENNSVTFDYVLRVNNSVADPWRIRLRVYSDSNIDRLSNCTIYFHDGDISQQICVREGSYTQQSGEWYGLTGLSADYIAINVIESSSGTSIIYAYLDVIASNSGISTLYKITFIIN